MMPTSSTPTAMTMTDDDDDDAFEPSRPARDAEQHPFLRRRPSRRCARNAASARCWSTISRRTACRSRARISPRTSRSRSISRSIRSASISSIITATAHDPLDLRATETSAAQLAERPRRHRRRPLARPPNAGARSRLAQAAAGGRLRRTGGTASSRPNSGSSPGASPPRSNRNLRSRAAPIR